MEQRPEDVQGPEPEDTDNGTQPDDGDQEISQDPSVDYSQDGES